jgi:hypothetical protein
VCVCHTEGALCVGDVYLFVVDCVDCCVALVLSSHSTQHSSVVLALTLSNNPPSPLPSGAEATSNELYQTIEENL